MEHSERVDAATTNAAPPQPKTSQHWGCANCGKVATQFCSKCKITRYCSKDCQKNGWAEHKITCAQLCAAESEGILDGDTEQINGILSRMAPELRLLIADSTSGYTPGALVLLNALAPKQLKTLPYGDPFTPQEMRALGVRFIARHVVTETQSAFAETLRVYLKANASAETPGYVVCTGLIRTKDALAAPSYQYVLKYRLSD